MPLVKDEASLPNEGKIYKAILSGNDPLTASVVENTLIGVPTLSKHGTGTWRATLTDGFVGNVIAFLTNNQNGYSRSYDAYKVSDSIVEFRQYNELGVLVDFFFGSAIIIEVYPI